MVRTGLLLDHNASRALRAAAGDVSCHLVGGALRDRLLGLSSHDIDAVVEHSALSIAERLSNELPARLVTLGDGSRTAYRLVGAGQVLDIWDRQRCLLGDELARRDFTVNSIALDLLTGRVVDPLGGHVDACRKLLRANRPGTFARDPLRVLRLARLAAELPGFTADADTIVWAREATPAISEVASERVRVELSSLLRARRPEVGLEILARLDVYPRLWLRTAGAPAPPGGWLAERLWRLQQVSSWLMTRLPTSDAPLDRELVLHAILLETLGSERSSEALEHLLSIGYVARSAGKSIGRILTCRELPRDQKAQRWWLHESGELWTAALAFSGVYEASRGQLATWRTGAEAMIRLVRTRGDEIFDPRPLLDGSGIAELLGVEPGPRIGQAVAAVRKAQVEGSIGSMSEAEALVRSLEE